MSQFWRAWFRNIGVMLAVIIGTCLFLLIFARIFYPDTISMTVQMLKWTGEIFSAFNLWPIVVLLIIVGLLTSTMPHRRRRYHD